MSFGNTGSTSLKFFKRLKIYKNSTGTVEFNPSDMTGRSYNWTFLAMVDGTLVFNNYNWSHTTSCHQSAVRSVLSGLKLQYIIGDFGQADARYINKEATLKLYKQLFELEVKIEATNRPESGANQWRIRQANSIRTNIAKLESLGRRFKVDAKTKKQLRLDAEFEELDRVSELESDKCFKFLTLKTASEDLNQLDLGVI